MPRRRPQGVNHIDLRYGADVLKAVFDLHLGSCPRAILKIRPPSSLDYRARQGPQTPLDFITFIIFHSMYHMMEAMRQAKWRYL